MQRGLKAAPAGPCPPGPQRPRPPAGKGAGLCPGHHQAEMRNEGGGHEGEAETRAHGRSAGPRGPFPGLSGHCPPGDLVRSYAAPPEPEDTPRLEPLSPQGKAGAGLGWAWQPLAQPQIGGVAADPSWWPAQAPCPASRTVPRASLPAPPPGGVLQAGVFLAPPDARTAFHLGDQRPWAAASALDPVLFRLARHGEAEPRDSFLPGVAEGGGPGAREPQEAWGSSFAVQTRSSVKRG